VRVDEAAQARVTWNSTPKWQRSGVAGHLPPTASKMPAEYFAYRLTGAADALEAGTVSVMVST
jgi:vancomycin permeability regulator SanA